MQTLAKYFAAMLFLLVSYAVNPHCGNANATQDQEEERVAKVADPKAETPEGTAA